MLAPRLRFQSAVWVRATLHHTFSHSFHAPPQDAGIDESNQLSAAEGFHEFADVSPISLETEDKILNGKCTPAGPHLSSDVVQTETPLPRTNGPVWRARLLSADHCGSGGELPQNTFRPAH